MRHFVPTLTLALVTAFVTACSTSNPQPPVDTSGGPIIAHPGGLDDAGSDAEAADGGASDAGSTSDGATTADAGTDAGTTGADAGDASP